MASKVRVLPPPPVKSDTYTNKASQLPSGHPNWEAYGKHWMGSQRKAPMFRGPTFRKIVLGLLWAYAAFKDGLDWFGRASLFEDSDHTKGMVKHGLELLFSVPWWAATIIAFIGTVLFFWPRPETTSGEAIEAHPIAVAPRIHCEARRLREISKTRGPFPELWENLFYLILQNTQSRTIRNVAVQFQIIDGVERCPVRGSDSFTSDIRHGDLIYFRLGRVVSTEYSGLPSVPGEPITKEEMKNYLHNVPKGFLKFEPAKKPRAVFSGGVGKTESKWTIPITITADDLPSK